MNYPYLSGINYESTADGPGIRAVFFLSGCRHQCPGCHNPATHNPCYGQLITDEMIETIANQLTQRPYLNGVTLSGGDPLFDPDKTVQFLHTLSNALQRRNNPLLNKSLWIFTGDVWERLMPLFLTNTAIQTLLLRTDVLVDGPFIQALANKTLAFRGSSNQRLIDVQQSLANQTVCLWQNTSSEV